MEILYYDSIDELVENIESGDGVVERGEFWRGFEKKVKWYYNIRNKYFYEYSGV